MNREEVISKLHDHDTRIRVLEIAQGRTMVWIGIGTVLANVLVAIIMKVLLK